MGFFDFLFDNKKPKQKRLNFSSMNAPQWYCCSFCLKFGCKLWRRPFSEDEDLSCLNCVRLSSGIECDVDKEGFLDTPHGKTVIIGELIPAVPCEDAGGYYGYTSIPGEGATWWRALPL